MNKDNIDFKAAMTHEQVYEGEENYQKQVENIGVTRRALFAFLAQSKKELIKVVKDEKAAEAVMALIEEANTHIDYLENVMSLMVSSRNRLLLVMAEVHGDR